MAGEQQVGNIVYEIEMNVARLIEGQRQVNDRLNKLDQGFNSTAKAVGNTEKSFTSLTKVASALAAAISVQQIAEYGNAWVTVNNKLANSVRANEQLADVTQRVFNISQDTRSSLEATATLYGRLERSTRSAGTSTADLIKLTTTINKGLTVSGATTEEASSTMTQLSQALASGVLRGEEFNSISENGSRLAVALADSLGVTIGQLRGMAAQGKLTTEVVVNGLLKQSDAIAKEFANTALTMGQAFTVATNNITKFVGESSSVSTSIKIFNQGVISLSENLDVVANVVAAAAVIFGGRFTGALAMATKARVDDALAARAQAVATAQSTAATATASTVVARKALLDKEAALSSLALAQAEYNVAKGSSAEGFALQNLNAVKSVAIQRSAAYAEAQIAQASATRTATAAAVTATTTIKSLASGALALIGGPVGAAVIAAAGIFYFYQKMQQARQESIDFADKLDGVIAKMRSMSQVQLAAEIDNASKSIRAQADALKDTQSTLEANELQQSRLRRTLGSLEEGSLLYKVTLSELANVQSEHTQLLAQNESAQEKLSQTVSKTGILRAQMNGTFAQGIDLLKRDGDAAGVASGLMNQFGHAIDFASRAKDKFNSTSLEIPRSDKADAYNKDLEDENTLLAITDKRFRAVTKARMEAGDKGGNQNQVNAAGQLAGAQYDLQAAEAARNKETKDGLAAGKKAETQAESIAQKLANLKQQSELAGDSTRELSREQAILTAQQSLGSAATQNDIRLAGQYAAAKWDTGNAIRAQAAAEKLLPETKADASYKQDVADLQTALSAKKISQEQYNETSERLEQEHQANLAKIRSEQAVTPQQVAAGTVDPVQALANENAQKLALIQQFENQKVITEQQSLALRNSLNLQYDQQRTAAMWQMWRNQSAGNEAVAASFDSIAGNASNAFTGMVTGSMSAEEAMSSLASNALNSLINSFVQMGVEWVKSAVMGSTAQISATAATTSASVAGIATTTAASTASAATTTVAWLPAAAAASIGSFGGAAVIGIGALIAGMALAGGLAGKRKNGGPVSAGSMYQVGEGGMPEIYQASSGKQYMIPGDNGSVISNKDMTSSTGGSGGVVINIQNYTSATVDAQASNTGGGLTIDVIVADLNQGGPIRQAITRNTTASARATE
ncbi:tape measure protein [Pantoea sp. EKM21T]|uniref:tape measure protein n=1 Tax=unclassified Pantoea TaxID=2630326 RepID=UPI00142E685D|nr:MULTISPECIES: tape measure protein [unclassified Pantoea]KAF6676798.1 tape measure protein [Pantoea sp. EKM21T]KAF6685946.1 tape measure protein [Pantoea sp. EKM22T]